MGLMKKSRRTLLLCASLPLFTQPVWAQDSSDDDEVKALQSIIVTGSRITQGGAQDAKHFRSIALDELDQQGLPTGDSLTVEGLLSEHDLLLPPKSECEQLFCISAHAKPSSLGTNTHFIGLGFDSGIKAEAYKAEPLSLIAVVDRSGSMTGGPITKVKESLRSVVNQMRDGDRLGIVIYGSDTRVHQPVIDVAGNRAELRRAIDAIAINGSTYMEAGMKLGFATAFEELPYSRGKTRLMLFTDENPNVGNTSADGFMGQAINGSRKGVGMTTIGVGSHFDGALATKVSSVRGGNLFFVDFEDSADELFAREFGNMVSEVAHDLVISIDPADGARIGSIYGVPGDLITDAGNGTVTVTIGSAFLSSNGGGIFATLIDADATGDAPMAEITVAYTDAITQKREADSDLVYLSPEGVPANLAKAELLVDQYVTMTSALAAYHEKRDPKQAAKSLAALSDRIATSGISGLEQEIALVDGLQSKARKLTNGRTKPWEVIGDWRVVRHRGVADISRGDLVEINEYGEFITERMSGRDDGEEIYQEFAINETILHIEDTDLYFIYRIYGDRLTLFNRMHQYEIVLERDDT